MPDHTGERNKLSDLRKEYSQKGLDGDELLSDPIAQFSLWLDQAQKAGVPEPNAMTLATSGIDGRVSARIVLLKGIDSGGFLFFTNYRSLKASQLSENPFASLVFLWHELERQVRVEGKVSKTEESVSSLYFDSRPRESQLGAWASEQSNELGSRDELLEKYSYFQRKFRNKKIQRPHYWGGYRLIPDKIEFWQGRASRLHDRIIYSISDNGWVKKRLSP